MTAIQKPVSKKKNTSLQYNARLWTTTHLFMGVFFAYAAAVNLNDPDWLPWVSLYGMASVLTIMAVFFFFKKTQESSTSRHTINLAMYMVTVLASAVLVQMVLSEEGVDGFSVHSERGREASGLMTTALWMILASNHALVETIVTPSVVALLAVLLVIGLWAIPKFILSAQDMLEHCRGLGFSGAK